MRKKTQTEMELLLSAYARYTGTKKAFCSEHSINVHVFNYWQKKLKGRKLAGEQITPKEQFIKLEVSAPSHSCPLSVVYPNGNRVELPQGVAADFLASLIRLSL